MVESRIEVAAKVSEGSKRGDNSATEVMKDGEVDLKGWAFGDVSQADTIIIYRKVKRPRRSTYAIEFPAIERWCESHLSHNQSRTH